MKLSRWEEIAISVLVACAVHSDTLIRTEVAARVAAASKDQTAHVVLALRKAGLIETVRGSNGGLRLVYAAESITLADVLHRVGSRARTDDLSATADDPLGKIALVASARAHEIFASFTIADLARGDVYNKLAGLSGQVHTGGLIKATTATQA